MEHGILSFLYIRKVSSNCIVAVPTQMIGLSIWILITKTPWQGAQTVIYCAVAEELEGVTGKYFGECREEKLVTQVATDDQAAERLWSVSVRMVGLNT